jgi:DNA-binding PadR family transcriptional regulator
VETPGRPIADEILAYLVKHPEAQDTLEGITEWWLLEQRIRSAVAEVDGALRNLVAEDLLVTRRCADGRTYYALNRGKEREIRRHLREAESARETKTDAGSNN